MNPPPAHQAQPAHHSDGITVIGSGSSMAAVDTVTVTLGVEVVRPDAGDAFRSTAQSVTALLAILADHGVDSRSVRTVNLSLGPRYDHRAAEPVINGYAAAQQLLVTLDGLSTIDRMLSDVVARSGEGLRIESVALTANNPREAESDARAAAMIDAREKATAIAALAGRPLGRVLRVDEHIEPSPRPVALMARSAGGSGSVMPIASGDTQMTVAISVHFAWAD